MCFYINLAVTKDLFNDSLALGSKSKPRSRRVMTLWRMLLLLWSWPSILLRQDLDRYYLPFLHYIPLNPLTQTTLYNAFMKTDWLIFT